jgi:hypothetical protein
MPSALDSPRPRIDVAAEAFALPVGSRMVGNEVFLRSRPDLGTVARRSEVRSAEEATETNDSFPDAA